jgi:hypothetical protein
MKTVHRPYRIRGILVAGFPLRPLRPSFASFAVKGSSVDPIWVDPEFVSRKQTLRPWVTAPCIEI